MVGRLIDRHNWLMDDMTCREEITCTYIHVQVALNMK